MTKPIIDLSWGIWSFGLIIPHASGILYSNNTEGCSLNRCSMEGVYIPLYNKNKPDPQEELWNFFGRSKTKSEWPDFIDDLLIRYTHYKNISVNKKKLNEASEAWIPVIISQEDRNWNYTVEGFSPQNGILTWLNSD